MTVANSWTWWATRDGWFLGAGESLSPGNRRDRRQGGRWRVGQDSGGPGLIVMRLVYRSSYMRPCMTEYILPRHQAILPFPEETASEATGT